MSATRSERSWGSRFVVAPYAVVMTSWNGWIAALCCLGLAAVFIAEVLTPDVVVGPLMLLPLIAGMWVLSDSAAAIVAGFFGILLTATLVIEPRSAWTIGIIGIALASVAGLTRLYAGALAGAIGSGSRLSALTAREREVAQLAGQAYTAAEIGARLHIAERTVETHLANAYTKLRISSRRELIRLVSRLTARQGR
jgi:DNA-binding CsgD family transcriptional regulator